MVVGTLWEAFETLVLPRTPARAVRFTRLFRRLSWQLWTAGASRMRSKHRRERFLSVYGPLSVFVLLTLWGAALVFGFALLQWSQREALFNVDGTAHFFDDVYMSATTLFALGLGDVAPKGRGGRLLAVAETASSLMINRGASPLGLPHTLSRALLRHARSVRVAHSLRSFALSRVASGFSPDPQCLYRGFAPRTPLLARLRGPLHPAPLTRLTRFARSHFHE